MKDLLNKLLGQIHWAILLYGLYGVYLKYEEHTGLIEGVISQFSGVEDEIKKTQKNLSEIQENMEKINEFKVRVDEVAKNIEAVQKQLPSDINESQIFDFLKEEMNVLNIKETAFTPGNESVSTYFVSKDLSIKGKGTYLQFLIFLERLGSASRIYNVQSLKLFSSTDSQKGRFQMINAEMILQAFRYNPDFKIERGFDKIESAAPAPVGE